MSISNFKKLALAAATGLLAMSANATSITIGDSHYIGSVSPGTPSSEADEVIFINYLLDMSAGDVNLTCFDPPEPITYPQDHTCSRDDSSLDTTGFADAVLSGSLKDDSPAATDFDVTGFTYLVAKYGQNSYVWSIAGLTDVELLGTIGQGGGLSHWTLFNPTAVPEPASLGLLGLGLIGTAIARRRRK